MGQSLLPLSAVAVIHFTALENYSDYLYNCLKYQQLQTPLSEIQQQL